MLYSACIVGGIGDIIFGLEGFKQLSKTLDEKKLKCYLCTHAPEGYDLVLSNPYVGPVEQIDFNYDVRKNQKAMMKIMMKSQCMGDALSYHENINPKIHLPKKMRKTFKKKMIIVHPGGSEFSKDYLGKRGKEMPKELWLKVLEGIDEDVYEIMVIGSNGDRSYINSLGLEKYNVAGEYTILKSINLIKHASLVIGVDSFAKSVGLACKIPTIVFVNSYEDHYRDNVFLKPYQEEPYAKIIWGADKTYDVENIKNWRDKWIQI